MFLKFQFTYDLNQIKTIPLSLATQNYQEKKYIILKIIILKTTTLTNLRTLVLIKKIANDTQQLKNALLYE